MDESKIDHSVEITESCAVHIDSSLSMLRMSVLPLLLICDGPLVEIGRQQRDWKRAHS
jgi:hypothetical protein